MNDVEFMLLLEEGRKALDELPVDPTARYIITPAWFNNLLLKYSQPHRQTKQERKQNRRSRVPSTGYYRG